MARDDPRELIHQAKRARNDGLLTEAIALQEQAVALLGEAGDADSHAHALRHLADMLSELGESAAAEPLYDAALTHYRPTRTLDAANAVRGAALNAERLDKRVAARALWQDARSRYAALDRLLVARTGANAGVAEAEQHLEGLGER